MANIYLVRHGESIANTESIYQGVTYDTDLSVLGKAQARALALRFESIDIRQVIASPLKRTVQTARLAVDKKHLDIYKEKKIIETNHGRWEGKPKDEIRKNWPKLYKKWLKFPSNVSFPQGERFLDTQKRVIDWWQTFCESGPGDTLVVSHDNIIRIIVARVLNMKLNRIWKFHLQPTSVTNISISSGKAQLVRLGDSAHLTNLFVDLSKQAL